MGRNIPSSRENISIMVNYMKKLEIYMKGEDIIKFREMLLLGEKHVVEIGHNGTDIDFLLMILLEIYKRIGNDNQRRWF